MVKEKKRPVLEADVVIDAIGDGLVLIDMDGKIITINPAFEKITGYKKSELVGKDAADVISKVIKPEDMERAMEALRTVREGKSPTPEPYTYYTLISKDGREISVALTATFIKDMEGKPTAMFAAIKDITELKRVEADFRQMSKVFTDAADPIIIKDLDGNVIDLNDEVERAYGWTREELIGKPIKTIVPSEGHEQADELLARCKAGEQVRNVERLQWNKSGEVIPVLLTLSLLTNELGKPIAIATISKSIAELKRVEADLRREKERAEEYLDIAGVMLAAVNADENITLINKKGCEILGYNEGELIGRNWFDILVPQRIRGKIRGVFRKLMAGDIKSVEYYENPLLTKDGEERLISFHNSLLRNPNGQIVGALTSGEDITERKTHEIDRLKEGRISVAIESIASRMTTEFGLNVRSEELGLLDIFTHWAQLSTSPAPRRIISFLETIVCIVLRQKGVKVSKKRVQKILRPVIKGFLRNIFSLERELGHELSPEYKELLTMYG